jgi:hypothetical protein
MVRTEIKVREVATLVHANRSQTVHEVAVAAAPKISHATCYIILPDDHHVSCYPTQSFMRPDIRPTDNRMRTCGDLIELRCRKSRLLLKDNAPAHRSVLVQVDLAKQQPIVCNTLHIHIISHMQFLFFSLLEKKAMWVSISVRQGKLYSTS